MIYKTKKYIYDEKSNMRHGEKIISLMHIVGFMKNNIHDRRSREITCIENTALLRNLICFQVRFCS